MSIRLQAYSPCACPMIGSTRKGPSAGAQIFGFRFANPTPVDQSCQCTCGSTLSPRTSPSKVRCFWSLSVILVWFWVGRKWEVGRWEGKKVSAAHSHVNEKSFRSLADMAWPSGWSAHLWSATVLLWYLSFVPTTCTYLTPKPPVPSLWVACPERRRNGLGGLNFLEFVKPWSRPVSI